MHLFDTVSLFFELLVEDFELLVRSVTAKNK